MPRGTRRYGSSLEISTYSELEHTCNLGRKLRNNFKLDYRMQGLETHKYGSIIKFMLIFLKNNERLFRSCRLFQS